MGAGRQHRLGLDLHDPGGRAGRGDLLRGELPALSLSRPAKLGKPVAAEVDALVARLPGCRPADTYFGEAWWAASRALGALGRGDDADAALRKGFEWVAQRASSDVPPEFRDSFLNRNPVNRDLLAEAARRLGLRVPPAPGPATTASTTSR